MSIPRRIAVLLLLGAIALSVFGCGDTVVDDSKAADAVQADLEKSFHEKIRSVDCPSDQKVEAGQTFTCTVDYVNGDEATATLEILNEEADVDFVGLKTNKVERGE